MKILRHYPQVGSLAYPGEVVDLTLVDFSDFDSTEKINYARSLIEKGATDPLVNELAHAIVRSVPPRDTIGQAKALLAWVQGHVTYVDDGVQMFRDAQYTIRHPSGNCLSAGAILFGSLCESIAIPVRLCVLEKKVGVFRRDPFHIYCQVGVPARNPTEWIDAEATQNVPLGWDVAAYAEANADKL